MNTGKKESYRSHNILIIVLEYISMCTDVSVLYQASLVEKEVCKSKKTTVVTKK